MHAGPYIHKENLQFGFDSGYSPSSAGKTKSRPTRSNRGRPTTNYIGNGNFSNGNGIENQYGSWGTYEIQTLKNPGKSPYVLAQRTGEYEIHFKNGTSIQPSTTYCQSCWVAYSKDWNGGTQIHHSRYYNGSGTGYAIGGAGTLARTRKIKGLTWEFRYATFTTQSTVNGNYNWYLGYSAGATTGWRYLADVKLEVGSYPTPFTKESRSSSESLINMNRDGNTINASTVSFDSNGIPTFDGTDDYISTERTASELGIYNGAYTMEAVFKLDTTSGDNMVFGTNQTSTSQGLHIGVRNGVVYQGHYAVDRSAGSVSANTWYHAIWVHTGSQSIMYINGSAINSLASHGAFLGTTDIWIGRHWGYFEGDIAVAKIYNRAFSYDEVQRNYNSYKTRFGL